MRSPALRFVADFAEPLAKVSRHVVADPRPVGGSLFRFHRDTRFSKDKSPHKFERAAPAVGEPLPAIRIHDASGQPFELTSLRGHHSVLVFGCLT